MNWRPVSELTQQILDESWRVLLWDGDVLWDSLHGVTAEGCPVMEDGGWYVEDPSIYSELWWVTHFMVLNAPEGE